MPGSGAFIEFIRRKYVELRLKVSRGVAAKIYVLSVSSARDLFILLERIRSMCTLRLGAVNDRVPTKITVRSFPRTTFIFDKSLSYTLAHSRSSTSVSRLAAAFDNAMKSQFSSEAERVLCNFSRIGSILLHALSLFPISLSSFYHRLFLFVFLVSPRHRTLRHRQLATARSFR